MAGKSQIAKHTPTRLDQRLKMTPAAKRLHALDPDLAQFCDQWEADDIIRIEEMGVRLVKAQVNQENSHPPIDWHPEREALDAERARLLVTGGNAVDAIMNLGELAVYAARQAAGIEAAKMMADAGLHAPHRSHELLPPPSDLGGGNGGDGDPKRVVVEDGTEPLRTIRDTAETARLGRIAHTPDNTSNTTGDN